MKFIEKAKYSSSQNARTEDVLISVNQRYSQKNRAGKCVPAIVFSFTRNSVKIFGVSEYMTFAFSDDEKRLYFKASDRMSGFKLSESGTGNTFVTKIAILNNNGLKVENANRWIGYYNLRYDKDIDLYYISISEKIH